ncbi:hypothetical protein DKX38_018333 [Salix brachista]|uniref:Uncharacterized protein n=1 Tax=Salix brachista TaxID=2182728 RepID=A0A5N5KMR1_9ROSI|nr:hypothetical protein DKX38_018333 [Salix brachista]
MLPVIYGVVKEVKVHLAGALYILVWMSLLSDIEMLCEAARGAYCVQCEDLVSVSPTHRTTEEASARVPSSQSSLFFDLFSKAKVDLLFMDVSELCSPVFDISAPPTSLMDDFTTFDVASRSRKLLGRVWKCKNGVVSDQEWWPSVHTWILDNESWLALLKLVDSQNISCVRTTLHAH